MGTPSSSSVTSVSKPFKTRQDEENGAFYSTNFIKHLAEPNGSPLDTEKMVNNDNNNKIKKEKHVCVEGYVEDEEEDICRTKSLTDDDLDELKGCLDLGFGFSYDEIPELCNTLPALELCYSMSQKYLDDQQQQQKTSTTTPDSLSDSSSCLSSSPKPNWKISSPGDDPEDVKARLKFWAQAVACTVKLCS